MKTSSYFDIARVLRTSVAVFGPLLTVGGVPTAWAQSVPPAAAQPLPDSEGVAAEPPPAPLLLPSHPDSVTLAADSAAPSVVASAARPVSGSPPPVLAQAPAGSSSAGSSSAGSSSGGSSSGAGAPPATRPAAVAQAGSPGSPGASPPPGRDAGSRPRSYLVLGIRYNGVADGGLRQQVATFIGQGYGSARVPALRATEQELYCLDLGCFQALVEQLGHYDFALRGELTSQPGRPGQTQVRLLIYNNNAVVAGELRDTVSADCSPTAADRRACFGAVSELLRKHIFHAPPRTYLSFERGLAQGIGLGTAASGLIAGAAVSYLGNQTYPIAGGGRSVTFDAAALTGYQAAGFTFMGLGLATLAASSLYGVWHAPFRAAPPAVRNRHILGLLMGTAGSMFAASLVGAIGSHAQSQTCIANTPSQPTCQLPAITGVAWGMTAVWGVSLAVSGIALHHMSPNQGN